LALPGRPDFSPLAERYARSRPRYPDALFDHLASLAPGRETAWDVATGSGQAALGLAARFDRVIATDLSAQQIRHAFPHPRVEYRIAPAEESGLEDRSVDLIASAAAVHWFDLQRFAVECLRVARPGALLAVWTYHVGMVEPPFDGVFHRFWQEHLKNYFAPATRLVDARYETLELPGEEIAIAPRFVVSAEWTLLETLDFVGSWSGSQAYREATGRDPVELAAPELRPLWGGAEGERRSIRWPIFLRVRRLGRE